MHLECGLVDFSLDVLLVYVVGMFCEYGVRTLRKSMNGQKSSKVA